MLDAKALSDEVTSAEISRLQEQNTLLVRLLESERLKSEKAKDQLISRISGLLGDFTAERDRSLRDAFEEMHNRNVIGEGEMEKCGNENGERIVNVIRAGEDWGSSLTRRGGESKRLRDGAFKVRIVSFRVGCHKILISFYTVGIELLTSDLQVRIGRCSEQCYRILIHLPRRPEEANRLPGCSLQ